MLGTFVFPRSAHVSGATPLTTEERGLITDAEQHEIARCMSEQGFAYAPPTTASPVTWYRDPAALQSTGYGVTASQMKILYGGTPVDASGGLDGRGREAWDAAYSGAPGSSSTSRHRDAGGGVSSWSSGGCLGSARTKIYGSVENFARFDGAEPIVSGNQVVLELRSKADFVAAMQSWQSCVNRSDALASMSPVADVKVEGNDDYGLNTLGRLWSLLRQVDDASLAKFAAVDGECQQSSGLFALRSARIDEARSSLLAATGIDVDTYLAYARWILARSITALGDR